MMAFVQLLCGVFANVRNLFLQVLSGSVANLGSGVHNNMFGAHSVCLKFAIMV
jgi:hypothetical protein